MPGVLYSCATPIGNLDDISKRLGDTLTNVDLIAAEDTRVSQKLCQHLDIKKPLIRLDQHKEASQLPHLLQQLSDGQSIALVSDAGTPNISDPGALLVAACHEAGIQVVPIPGPSAVTTLLSAAGFMGSQFYFGGYFPRKSGQALSLIETLPNEIPLVFFESPNRIEATVALLSELPFVKDMVIGKELTKTFEWIYKGSPAAVHEHLQQVPIKGEWTFAFVSTTQATDPLPFVQHCKELGLSQKQCIAIGQGFLGYSKNDLYRLYLSDHD